MRNTRAFELPFRPLAQTQQGVPLFCPDTLKSFASKLVITDYVSSIRTKEEVQALLLTIKEHPQIRELAIDFTFVVNEEIGSKERTTISDLIQIVTTLPTLEGLGLNIALDWKSGEPLGDVAELLVQIVFCVQQHCTHLRSLTMGVDADDPYLPGTPYFTKISNLGVFSQVQELHLKHLECFATGALFPNLRDLRLDYDYWDDGNCDDLKSKVTPIHCGAPHVALLRQDFSQLERLSLTDTHFNRNTSLADLLSQSHPHFCKLRFLKVHMNGGFLEPVWLAFQKQTSLEHLQLTINYIPTLFKSFQCLPKNLKIFQFQVAYPLETEEKMTVIPWVVGLQEISIDCGLSHDAYLKFLKTWSETETMMSDLRHVEFVIEVDKTRVAETKLLVQKILTHRTPNKPKYHGGSAQLNTWIIYAQKKYGNKMTIPSLWLQANGNIYNSNRRTECAAITRVLRNNWVGILSFFYFIATRKDF
jgi:hypothetical protein